MENSGPQNAEDTVGSFMDGVLLLANADEKVLMRPQLNANYRHLCSPSNPVTSLLFGDDLPKAVKDISDTNRLGSKLTKDNSSTHSAKRRPQCPYWQGKKKNDCAHNTNKQQARNYQSLLHFRRKQEGKKKNPIQVSLATGKFAGRLRHFLPAWSSIRKDQNILNLI